MKLFKSLLVAPATLGLIAPMSATANEVTISNFAPAEQLAVTNSRVDGLEARLNNIEAGSFSETTTASFSADMAIGALDGIAGQEAVTALYGFQIDLNTSFTGEDSLDISIDAGNGAAAGDGLD
ncbi:porin, partial [Prochlorococcus marinus CUG1415]|nr:porin [Prochlorococcus marinus CUG1415]